MRTYNGKSPEYLAAFMGIEEIELETWHSNAMMGGGSWSWRC